MSAERDQFYLDVFITALEGGIGYWSECEKYHWQNDGVEDFSGFVAVIHDAEDDEVFIIDRSVIVRGCQLMRTNKDSTGAPLVADYIHSDFASGYSELDAGDIDADIADCIVQAGLFGKVVYG